MELRFPKPEIKDKLTYNSNLLVNKSNISNILLIDENVQDYQIFFNSSNEKTFPITYNGNCLRTELETLFSQFDSIDRICFVFDETGIPTNKLFINYSSFFKTEDLKEDELNKLSENFKFLINSLGRMQVKFIDFLACNSLNYTNFVNFYEKIKYFIKKEFNYDIIIGASNDKTGNMTWGGDWTLENTGIDVKDLYFTSQIETYAHLLANGTNINFQNFTSVDVYQENNLLYWKQTGTQISTQITSIPITCTGNGSTECTINITSQIVGNINFICASKFLTFNGNGNTITITNINNYQGLVKNGDSYNSGIYSNITIKNIILSSSGTTTLADYGGWLACRYFGLGSVDNSGYPTCLITNCSSNGIITTFSGGIVGANCTCKVTYCYSSGDMVISNYAGGIVGSYANSFLIENQNNIVFKTIVENSYSTGNINNNAGGIFGSFCNNLKNNSSCIANYCYSTGEINSSGGIYGSFINVNSTSSTCEANYCYSKGEIINSSGGIFGYYLNFSTITCTCEANYCYSTGKINENCGGIFSQYSNYDSTLSTCEANYCYVLCNGNNEEESNYGTFFGSDSNQNATTSTCLVNNSYAVSTNPNFFGPNSGDTLTQINTVQTQSWEISIANDTINSENNNSSNWFNYNDSYPFLLSGFRQNFYNGVITANVNLNTPTNLTVNPTGTYYELFNENQGVTINSNGQLQSTILGTQIFTVLQSLYNEEEGENLALNLYRYNFVDFTLIVSNPPPVINRNVGDYFLSKINDKKRRKFRLLKYL